MVDIPALTPAMQSVFIITQYCLPMIFEPAARAAGTPLPGKVLSADERRLIGLTTPGMTVGYRIDGVDMFFDRGGEHATVWFANGDFTAAAVLLEEMLRTIFKEEDLTLRPVPQPPGNKGTLTREIVIAPAGSPRAAVLSVTFGPPEAQGDARMFFCRIFPQQRVN